MPAHTSSLESRMRWLNSRPSMTRKSSPGLMMPHLVAMDRAVLMLSPVTIRTVMPDAWQLLMAIGTWTHKIEKMLYGAMGPCVCVCVCVWVCPWQCFFELSHSCLWPWNNVSCFAYFNRPLCYYFISNLDRPNAYWIFTNAFMVSWPKCSDL